MKTVHSLAIAVIVLSIAGCGTYSPGRVAGVATGMVSHELCSAVFVAGLDPDTFYEEALRPLVGPMGFLIGHKVDRERADVTATIMGLGKSSARYSDSVGCRVTHAELQTSAVVRPARTQALLAPIADNAVVTPSDAALVAALDKAFEEPASGPQRRTKAVVIVHRGRVIAERYARGYGVDTPLHGWSATKSVTNALLGILVREAIIDMHAPAPIAAWSDASDPRHAITPDNLLRMASGLANGQNLTAGFSDVVDFASQMMFDESDMAGFAERAQLRATPGSAWNYSNANTALLARMIRDASGGTQQSVLAFAQRELFDKLDMQHVTLELDEAATPMSATHMWAPARDWARFGMLYLNDGVVGDKRILPEGWVDYSAALTPTSEDFGYGAGFWTNRGDSKGARIRTQGGMPQDSFMARGSFGQYVIVIPSMQLVIARFGYSFRDRGDIEMANRLVKDVVAALAP